MALLSRSRDMLAMPQTAKSTAPTGGVIRPKDKVQADDDAHVDRVDADGGGNGGQHRGHDDQGRGGLHGDAQKEEKNVDQEQDHVGRCGQVGNPLDDKLRDLVHRDKPGERLGHGYEQHHHARFQAGGEQHLGQVLDGQLAVVKRPHDGRIQHRDAGRFGRREHAAQDAAHDQHRHEQGRQRLPGGDQDLFAPGSSGRGDNRVCVATKYM